ncbi:glycoprotein hormones alpha chain [Salarias fasciatus]|uniref:glycoprotein hormones alpha chain n=1 Tax=Salarias fasciatus TaxID=181472 RepID=UPI001176B305|nr:glycoprotein hormones alpha chain [Salarias fasciatus]
MVKPAGLSLLLLSALLQAVESYPNMEAPNMGCEECSLQKNDLFTLDQPIYQCKGCCFSRAYPTPLRAMDTMLNRKNITSEATCCVAKHSYEVRVNELKLRNQTECHCSTCLHHQI